MGEMVWTYWPLPAALLNGQCKSSCETISVRTGPLIHSLLQAKIQEYLSPPAGKAVCSWLRGWGRPGKQQGALGNSQGLKGAGRDLKIPPSLQVPCWAGAGGRKNMVLTLKSVFLVLCLPSFSCQGYLEQHIQMLPIKLSFPPCSTTFAVPWPSPLLQAVLCAVSFLPLSASHHGVNSPSHYMWICRALLFSCRAKNLLQQSSCSVEFVWQKDETSWNASKG